MNSPLFRLKVPYGLYGQANKKGLLSVVKFYYKLKSLRIDGCFLESEFIELCQDNLFVSYNTAKKYKNLLISNQFAYIRDNHLCLVRYDSLWEKLEVQKNKNGFFKLMYVSLANFESEIQYNEICLNLKNQAGTLRIKHLRRELKTDTVKNANRNLKKILSAELSSAKMNLARQIESIRQKLSSILEVNYQVTLTCKKVAEIFGFKSATQGRSIIRSMVSIGKIRSTSQNIVFVAKNVNKHILKSLNLDSSFFIYKNVLLKRLPNMITLI